MNVPYGEFCCFEELVETFYAGEVSDNFMNLMVGFCSVLGKV